MPTARGLVRSIGLFALVISGVSVAYAQPPEEGSESREETVSPDGSLEPPEDLAEDFPAPPEEPDEPAPPALETAEEFPDTTPPASRPFEDDAMLRVPVQLPVPPPPKPEDPIHDWPMSRDRSIRFFDISTDFSAIAAREGGMLRLRSFGGYADQLVMRGATQAYGADLQADIDGMPMNIGLAGRGVNYLDLRQVPVAAIESIRIAPGPFERAYAGRLSLKTRHLDGVSGGLLFGGSDTRRFSLAAGHEGKRGNGMLAVEVRNRENPAGPTDDRQSILGRLGTRVGDMDLALNLRFYRQVWDELGTVQVREFDAVPDRDPSDGGELYGVGASVSMDWNLSKRGEMHANIGYLEDFFQGFVSAPPTTSGGPLGDQSERVDRHRTVHGDLGFTYDADWDVPTRFHGSARLDYALSRTRANDTAGRVTLRPVEQLRADWVQAVAMLGVDLSPSETTTLGAWAAVHQLTVRTESALSAPDTRSVQNEHLEGGVYADYENDGLALGIRFAHSARTHPDALRSERIFLEQDSLEVRVRGLAAGTSNWQLDWSFGGYGTLYGGTFFDPGRATGRETLVTGGELGLELIHKSTGLRLVGRGGPLISFPAVASSDSLLDGFGDARKQGLRAVGVPDYIAHVGLLMHQEKGLVAEFWLDAYGRYALTPEPLNQGGKNAKEFVDLTGRTGFRGKQFTLWLGLENMLDKQGAELRPAVNRITLRRGRTFFAQLTFDT